MPRCQNLAVSHHVSATIFHRGYYQSHFILSCGAMYTWCRMFSHNSEQVWNNFGVNGTVRWLVYQRSISAHTYIAADPSAYLSFS